MHRCHVSDRLEFHYLRRAAIVLAGLFTAILFGAADARAASIPAWLDDAITGYNEHNTSTQIQFVDIQDSYVWYRILDTDELGSKEIRGRIYGIAEANGYTTTSAEELITTDRPPGSSQPHQDKKCWKRSFVLDTQTGSSGRMLSTSVCEDQSYWFAGFRILQ